MISITYSPYVCGGYYYGSFIMAAVVTYSYSRYFFRSHLTKGEGNNDVVLSGHHPLAREHNFSPAYALLCTIFQFIMPFGIFLWSAGLKSAITHPYQEFHRAHAWMLVGGLVAGLVSMQLCKFTLYYSLEEGDKQYLYNVDDRANFNHRQGLRRRRRIWLQQIAVALCLLPLSLLVDMSRNSVGDVVQGLTAAQLQGILLV